MVQLDHCDWKSINKLRKSHQIHSFLNDCIFTYFRINLIFYLIQFHFFMSLKVFTNAAAISYFFPQVSQRHRHESPYVIEALNKRCRNKNYIYNNNIFFQEDLHERGKKTVNIFIFYEAES